MPRNSIEITLSVWKALLLREALARLFSRRAAWFWLLLEPVFHVAYLMLIFTVVRIRQVGGIETPVWIMVGLIAFFMFSHTARQSMGAVGANQSLFVYRQVQPVDTVLSRCVLEGTVMLVAAGLLLPAVGMFGLHVWPGDPMTVLVALLGMWLLGVGFGLVGSVIVELLPEVGRVLVMLMRPLYLASGVVFPLGALPPSIRDILMLNPIAHGLEAIRLGFAPYYHSVPGVSVSYIYLFALVLLLSGMLLQVGLAKRMVSQ